MKSYRHILDPSLVKERRGLYISYIFQLLKTVSAVTLALALKPDPRMTLIKKFFKAEKFERHRFNQTLKRLEKRGLVKRQKRDDGNEYLLLTQAGEAAFKAEKCRTLALHRPEKWDGYWRIVVFDIKEDKKTVRDAMRRHLRKLGFYALQKSVFITPCPCDEEIRFLQEFYESEGDICLIKATSLGTKEKIVRKNFIMK